MQKIIAPNLNITLWKACFSQKASQRIFQHLYATTQWQQDTITLFGKTHPTPRLQAWYGDHNLSYHYSGIALQPTPWTTQLKQLKHRIEQLTTATFNSVLLNLYRNGQDSNGWHSDDEPELGDNPVIASLSFGATRRFRLRHKQAKEREIPLISLDLESGSLLLMAGQSQSHWQHCLTKTAKTVGPRINLTFRYRVHSHCKNVCLSRQPLK